MRKRLLCLYGLAAVLLAGVAATQIVPEAAKLGSEESQLTRSQLLQRLNQRQIFLAYEETDGLLRKIRLEEGEVPVRGFVDLRPGEANPELKPPPAPGAEHPCCNSLALCDKALNACLADR